MAGDVILNTGLAFVFISAAVFFASRINYSSIPFLIFTGMMFGPHAPDLGTISLRLISDTESVELLSRTGVLLMLFYLGLEFSAGKIAESGKNLFKSGSVYVTLNFARGLGFGWVFFGTWWEALVVAGITGISSSAIITKLLVDLKRAANPETELILGIMVFEDVFVAVYLSVLSGIMAVGGFSPWRVLLNAVVILGFVFFIVAYGRRFGMFIEKRLRFRNPETFVIAVFTLLLISAVLAERLNIAEAMGALLLGLVMAETIHNQRIVQVITPMRDIFGSVFFFSFGMAIDWRDFAGVAAMSAAAVLMTVFGNIVTGYIASWLSGYKKRRAANVAFTIMARGEFSIIIAGFAASAGLGGDLPAFAALYVVSLAFISPILARHSKLFNELFDRAGRFFKKDNGLDRAGQGG